MPTATKPSRYRLQISLRTLLLLVAVVSLPFGWFGYRYRQARAQQEGVTSIRKSKGGVRYDFEIPVLRNGEYLGNTEALKSGTPAGPAWLRNWLGIDFFNKVVVVSLYSPAITDDSLECLASLPTLRCLFLRGTSVTDSGLVHLRGLTQLEELYLDQNKIGDAGLSEIRRLSALRYLDLDSNPISDLGATELRKSNGHEFGLDHLEILSLNSTAITDASLDHLGKNLHELRSLSVNFTGVTKEGVSRLEQRWEKCSIYYTD